MNGGELIAEVLRRQGVRWLFTLCGGHISPILVESKRRGIRVVDWAPTLVRDVVLEGGDIFDWLLYAR